MAIYELEKKAVLDKSRLVYIGSQNRNIRTGEESSIR